MTKEQTDEIRAILSRVKPGHSGRYPITWGGGEDMARAFALFNTNRAYPMRPGCASCHVKVYQWMRAQILPDPPPTPTHKWWQFWKP